MAVVGQAIPHKKRQPSSLLHECGLNGSHWRSEPVLPRIGPRAWGSASSASRRASRTDGFCAQIRPHKRARPRLNIKDLEQCDLGLTWTGSEWRHRGSSSTASLASSPTHSNVSSCSTFAVRRQKTLEVLQSATTSEGSSDVKFGGRSTGPAIKDGTRTASAQRADEILQANAASTESRLPITSHGGRCTGATQDGIGPEGWGITLQQIERVLAEPRYMKPQKDIYGRHTGGGMTMRDVVDRIIKPVTAGQGVGYALLQNRTRPLVARVMVSHAWDEQFEDMLAALRSSRLRGPFWICAMAIYQPEDIEELTIEKQLGPSPQTSPFATVLKQAELMLCVTTRSCNLYTRMWCVYEMFFALQLGTKIVMAQGVQYSDDCGFLDTFTEQCKEPVNSRLARCGRPDQPPNEDELRIRREIESQLGGYDLIDVAVEVERLSALYARRVESAVVDARRRRAQDGGLTDAGSGTNTSEGPGRRSAAPEHGQDLQKMYSHCVAAQLRRLASKGAIVAPYSPVLARALQEDSPIVRQAGAQALGALGVSASQHAEALKACALDDNDEDVRTAAAEALGRMGTAASAVIASLADTVANSSKELARCRAAKALGLIGHAAEAHVDVMSQALMDKSPAVRLSISGVLAGLAAARAFKRKVGAKKTPLRLPPMPAVAAVSTQSLAAAPSDIDTVARSTATMQAKPEAAEETVTPVAAQAWAGNSAEWIARKELIKDNFREGDLDNDGLLDFHELSLLLRRGRSDMSDVELRTVFRSVDRDSSGRISLDEFVDFVFSHDDLLPS